MVFVRSWLSIGRKLQDSHFAKDRTTGIHKEETTASGLKHL
jgi:hypothetical protein